ncbi:restriction endonuclease subunit S [Mannheimia indoligenes]|uniref:restriction endonuclease subunit S n=1 Tax=Mannheimia indoligenes TaxID=3103145 RepID=UPI002FE545A8
MGSVTNSKRAKTGRQFGKIETHLAEKLACAEWGEFRIGDLFEVTRGLSMYVEDKQSFSYTHKDDPNAIPLVQQMNHSNGICAYIDKTKLPERFKNKIEKAGRISINPDQPLSYYQQKEFIGNSVIIIDTSELTQNQAFFIVGEIQRIRQGSTWNEKFPKELVKTAIIRLPTQNGEIDFSFMENFIAELHAYLQATGLSNYTLNDNEQAALNAIKTAKWQIFNVIDVFNVKNTFNILSRDIVENSGNVPYLSASRENNAVSSYISYDESFLDRGNCIFIGGKTFVVTYQEQDFYSNDSHNLCLYLKETEKLNKLNQFFMISCLEKGLSHQYSWGNSISNKKIQKDQFLLPVKDGKIDYEFMETFISAIQKLVIKDVVQWADKQIEATEQVILN